MTGDLVFMAILLSALAIALQPVEPQLDDAFPGDAGCPMEDPVTVAALCGVHL